VKDLQRRLPDVTVLHNYQKDSIWLLVGLSPIVNRF
jgi:hypothetical protein